LTTTERCAHSLSVSWHPSALIADAGCRNFTSIAGCCALSTSPFGVKSHALC
jgi:hypothetical protein